MANALLQAYEQGDTQALIALLEQEALKASQQSDEESFSKAYAQLAPLYAQTPFVQQESGSVSKAAPKKRTTRARAAASSTTATTSQRPFVTALHLLLLLTRQDIAGFHASLESLSPALLSTPEVGWATRLEQHITEGSYQEVKALLSSPPETAGPDAFRALAGQVGESIRREIANCIGSAYTSLPVVNLAALLMMQDGGKAAVSALCAERGWHFDQTAGRVFFKPATSVASSTRLAGTNNADAMAVDDETEQVSEADVEAYGGAARRAMLSQTLGYARELESIV